MPDFASPPWSTPSVERRRGAYLVPVVLIVVVAFVLLRVARLFVHGIIKALLDREATEGTAQELSAVELKKRMDTLDSLGGNVLRFFVLVIAGLMILRAFGLDIGPAIAGLGVVGVAVGFGAQDLVRDYLNGALILIENQFSKGDVIRVAGVAGTVEDFSLRRTTLRDLDGVVHTVPNGQITVASNLTRVWARINLDVPSRTGRTSTGDDGRQRGRPGMAADPAWKRRLLEAPSLDRVARWASTASTLKILGTVRAQDQWAAAGRASEAPAGRVHGNGIEIPPAAGDPDAGTGRRQCRRRRGVRSRLTVSGARHAAADPDRGRRWRRARRAWYDQSRSRPPCGSA